MTDEDYIEAGMRARFRQRFRYSIKTGKIPRIHTQVCKECEQPAKQYHHYLGLNKWDQVIPLCYKCHKEAHMHMKIWKYNPPQQELPEAPELFEDKRYRYVDLQSNEFPDLLTELLTRKRSTIFINPKYLKQKYV